MIKLRLANQRGHANHGWLDSYHSFSFADYYDPEQVGFRSLRVINEDRVQGGKGFDLHPHRDMEIVTYVISGALKHEDCMGHAAVMKAGDVQRITAGTGIEHSEYNHSRNIPVHFLQIWLLPSQQGLPPDYAQESFGDAPQNALTLACSPDGRNKSIRINQGCDLFIGKLGPHAKITHSSRNKRNAWIQLIAGTLGLNGTMLSPGDGAMVQDELVLHLDSEASAHFLLFDLN